ncbi:MAG: AmmeMemoRadiSam system protein B [Deltaproteobacteria bacterium]|nr:AmmeMemoRadiSam system protein B [Deltaproteobacteria bacterium]
MTPKPINPIALTLMLALLLCGTAAAETVRQPVGAGSFYPAEPRELRTLIDRLAQNARSAQQDLPDRRSLRALILPHAGYPYSGLTAAHAARVLSEDQFKTVLLMGPDHFVGFRSAAVPAVQAFQTPLGKIPLHPAAADLLKQPEIFAPLPPADDREHSLEVVLPFLQAFLKAFELIPLVVGRADGDRLCAALLPWVDRETLVVVSSDLSHFLPYAEAQAKDRRTIDAILARDRRALAQDVNSACGAHPLAILLAMADRFGWRPVLLNYLNSGDTAGDRARVVGYAAIAFFGDPPMPAMKEASHLLAPEKGQELVKLARITLMEKFGLPLPPAEADRMRSALSDASFQTRCGTFVTLKQNGRLRGCIGSLSASDPLAEGVRRNAISAAFHDPRFSPLTEKELGQVEIEVSVLTEPQPLPFSDPAHLLRRLRPDVDGVIIRQGYASATFLPQVWEQLPQKEDFLGHLCLKAGLPRDAWKRGKLEVSTYQVQYFEEHK